MSTPNPRSKTTRRQRRATCVGCTVHWTLALRQLITDPANYSSLRTCPTCNRADYIRPIPTGFLAAKITEVRAALQAYDANMYASMQASEFEGSSTTPPFTSEAGFVLPDCPPYNTPQPVIRDHPALLAKQFRGKEGDLGTGFFESEDRKVYIVTGRVESVSEHLIFVRGPERGMSLRLSGVYGNAPLLRAMNGFHEPARARSQESVHVPLPVHIPPDVALDMYTDLYERVHVGDAVKLNENVQAQGMPVSTTRRQMALPFRPRLERSEGAQVGEQGMGFYEDASGNVDVGAGTVLVNTPQGVMIGQPVHPAQPQAQLGQQHL
ncbi:hypothetical protein BDW74DRAFT_180168 [Aspergillus multicolor]|uniref:uncharacterized protein n=1 Tax=Aspergillus multicolor TaxID=41759 RepID=UPI003CCE42C6